MITLREYLEAIDFKITGGSDYCWECFGPNARYLDSDDKEGYGGKYHVGAVFDSANQTVYQVEVWDYENDREYRWTHPEYAKAHRKNAKKMDVDHRESADGRNYIDLEVPEDILDKIAKIIAGEEYDTRVEVPLTLPDDQLFELMKTAHERDITLNELVEEVLTEAIESARLNLTEE